MFIMQCCVLCILDIIVKSIEMKLESIAIYPENGQESNDYNNVFSLPQYIRVMISNYQLLQTVFAIDKGECESLEIMTEEQLFFPM